MAGELAARDGTLPLALGLPAAAFGLLLGIVLLCPIPRVATWVLFAVLLALSIVAAGVLAVIVFLYVWQSNLSN